MTYDVFRLNNGCDLEVHSKVITIFVQKSLKVSLILGIIISLDLIGHSLRAKSGLSAEMGTKPQVVDRFMLLVRFLTKMQFPTTAILATKKGEPILFMTYERAIIGA